MTRMVLLIVILTMAAMGRASPAPTLVDPAPTPQTASVAGIVVAGSDNRPVRLAIVTITSRQGSYSRGAITDDAGRFAFSAVPAGTYTLQAAKAAHITTAFGARRPGRPGTPITVTGGTEMRDLRIELPRGAVITGAVRDQSGQAVPNVGVAAVRSDAIATPGVTLRPAEVTTDDRGIYRIFGLTPGEYFIVATMRVTGIGEMGAMTSAEIDQVMRDLQAGRPATPAVAGAAAAAQQSHGFASTYLPSAIDPADAQRIRVNAGDDRQGADITLQLVRTSVIEGTVTSPDGGSVQSVRVLLQGDRPTFGLSLALALSPTGVVPDARGRFRFDNVIPGRYQVLARTAPPGRGSGPSPSAQWARADVTATGDDITGVALALRPGLQMSGKVVVDAAGEGAPRPADLRVTLRPESAPDQVAVDVPVAMALASASTVVSADGTFVIGGILPGRYVPMVTLNPPAKGWLLQSAIVNGRDALDHGLDIDADNLSMVLTYTNRATELTGSLQTPGGQPATEYFVIVFPSDRDLWRPRARRVQTARPDTSGRFTFLGLPAGEYQIAALTDVEPDEWNDPNFLAALVPASIKLSIAAGERKVQDLRIGR